LTLEPQAASEITTAQKANLEKAEVMRNSFEKNGGKK